MLLRKILLAQEIDQKMSYKSFSSLWKILLLCLIPVTTEACSPGKWGKNCSSVCGHCKDGVECNSKTGECPAGCAPGYRKTLRCENECPEGSFGQDCQMNCLLDCEICNKVNGLCTLCKDNLQGFNCNERQTKPATDQHVIFPAAIVLPTALGVTCLLSVLLTVLVGISIIVQRRRSQAISTILPRPEATGRSHETDTTLELQTLDVKN